MFGQRSPSHFFSLPVLIYFAQKKEEKERNSFVLTEPSTKNASGENPQGSVMNSP
jgi:hypothetical protein